MLTYDLEDRGDKTIYEYLYQCMKEDIISGKLACGDKLPSKRKLANQHQISLKTVENAYEQLVMEGYVTAQEKKGYFVMESEAKYSGNAGKKPFVQNRYQELQEKHKEKETVAIQSYQKAKKQTKCFY